MKKGQELSNTYMVGMVVMIIVILIVVLIVKSWSGKAISSLNEKECEQSVLSHVKWLELNKMASKSAEQIPPINCPTINYTITSKKEEEIKYQLADKMKICWDNWQRGEKELFMQEAIYCNPCYIVDFKHDDLTIENFDQFLLRTNVPGEKYTYMQYFSGGTNNDEFSKEKLSEIPELNSSSWGFGTDTKKVIMFYYVKDRDEIKERMEALGYGAGGATIGGVTGGIIFGGVCSFIPGVGTAICAGVGATLGAAAGGFIGGMIAASDYPLWISHILIKEYNEQSFKELNCSISPGKQTNLYYN